MLPRCQDLVYRFVLVSVLVPFTGPACALTFPALTGRVVDEAGILDPATKATLEQKLSDFETKTTGQLVVVTLKSLQGTSIEDYGYQLGRHWQIGQKEKNTGALLIVAPNERKVRIEVGYGFEGTLTAAILLAAGLLGFAMAQINCETICTDRLLYQCRPRQSPKIRDLRRRGAAANRDRNLSRGDR